MRGARGFTLIELLVAVAVIVLIAGGAAGVTMSSRAMAVETAALRFDGLLDAARTTAHELDRGVTLAIVPDAYGDGFTARLYRNRPETGTLTATNVPAAEGRVALSESETLGAPPFALTIHGTGLVAGIRGGVDGANAAPETPCPASGAYHLVFTFAGARQDRYVPCRIALAAGGPVAYVMPPPATPAPQPTAAACLGSCATLPPSPNPSPGGALTVDPTSLAFQNAGLPAALVYHIREPNYAGAFRLNDDCGGAIAQTPVAGSAGPAADVSVSALRSSVTCTIRVADERGNSASVAVAIALRLGQRFTCDAQAPPRPYGTDIGPDADGTSEDFSDGTTCSAAAAVVTLAFEGRTAAQISAIAGSQPQPCDTLPVLFSQSATSGDATIGGWYEDDWYVLRRNVTAGAFRTAYQVQSAGGDPIYGPLPHCDLGTDPSQCTAPIVGYTSPGLQWRFVNAAASTRAGTFVDPSPSGAVAANGSYGTSAQIPASTIALSAIASADAALPLVEQDVVHESCFATWSNQQGGP